MVRASILVRNFFGVDVTKLKNENEIINIITDAIWLERYNDEKQLKIMEIATTKALATVLNQMFSK